MKMIFPTTLIALTVMVAAAPAADPPRPAPAAVLPDTTCEYVTVPDLARWDDDRSRTFGMFIENSHVQRCMRDLEPRWHRLYELPAALGLTWDGLRAAAGGAAAWAVVVPPGDNRVAWVLLLDTRGKAEARVALRERLADAAKAAGGSVGTAPADDLGAGRELTTYRSLDKLAVYHLDLDEMWIVSNDRDVLAGIVKRWGTAADDALVKQPSYRYVADQTKAAAGEPDDIHWFVQPFLRAEAARVVVPWPKKQGKDPLTILKPEGFGAIKAVGGRAGFGLGERVLTYRTAVHAPKPPGGYVNGMRLAHFPNGPPLAPEAWVPGDALSYLTFRWNVANGFDTIGSIFDRFVDEDAGLFESILKSLKEDPNGPGIDVRKEIIATLENRVTLVAAPRSGPYDAAVIAIPTRDEKTVAEALRKSFQNDRKCVKRVFEGHTIWQLQTKPPKSTDPALAKSRVFAAAMGHIFAASRPDMMEQVLRRGSTSPLGAAPDHQSVTADLTRLAPGAGSARMFGRLAPDAEPTTPIQAAAPTTGVVPKIFPGPIPSPEPVLAPKPQKPGDAAPYGYAAVSLPDGLKIVGVLHKPNGK